jgi:holo-[acyl-carrier protein] synthase
MINGIGIDIIKIDRIKKAIKKSGKRFLRKIFTAGEIKYCLARRFPEMHFASRFAAKEAVAKAAGTGLWRRGFSWRDIDIVNHGDNSPIYVEINGKLKRKLRAGRILISMSHCRGYAAANAVILK